MNTETETLITVLRSRMEKMDEGERKDLIDQLSDGYCERCLSDDMPCYCWNDE